MFKRAYRKTRTLDLSVTVARGYKNRKTGTQVAPYKNLKTGTLVEPCKKQKTRTLKQPGINYISISFKICKVNVNEI